MSVSVTLFKFVHTNISEEDKRRVDPTTTKTKRIIKNPRFVLNPARLTGPRGIQVIPDHFKDFKFKGNTVHNKKCFFKCCINKLKSNESID